MISNISSQFWGLFKRHYILIVFLLVIISAFSLWKYEFPSATWRYKITVIVETPEGVKTGSTVREVRQYTDINIGGAGGGNAYERGEATIVDLGKRGKIFLTIGEDHRFLFRAFPFSKGGNTAEGIHYYSHLKNVKASILALNNITPLLVTFDDPNNPLTVKAVEPSNLAAIFGKGVNLQDIIVETTDEPMTLGIVDPALPWLNSLHGGYLDGKSLGGGPHLSNILYGGNFKTGDRK